MTGTRELANHISSRSTLLTLLPEWALLPVAAVLCLAAVPSLAQQIEISSFHLSGSGGLLWTDDWPFGTRTGDTARADWTQDFYLSWTNRWSIGTQPGHLYRVESTHTLSTDWQTNSSVWATTPSVSAKIRITEPWESCFVRIVRCEDVLCDGRAASGFVYHSTNVLPYHPVMLNTAAGRLQTLSDSTGFYSIPLIISGSFVSIGSWFLPYPEQGQQSWTYSVRPGQDEDLHHDVYVLTTFALTFPPNNATISSASPIFMWEPVEEAERYTFRLVGTEDGALVEEASSIATNSHIVATELTRGVRYTWHVIAWDENDRAVGTTASSELDSTFCVAD